MDKKVNRYNYEVIYALHNITKDYLKEINDEIKEKGIDKVISCNDDKNIELKERKAKAKYSPEDQAKIDKFIADNHIEKITETKENYKVEIIPSEKAIKEFNKMLDDLENSQHKNIAKVASKVKKSPI